MIAKGNYAKLGPYQLERQFKTKIQQSELKDLVKFRSLKFRFKAIEELKIDTRPYKVDSLK